MHQFRHYLSSKRYFSSLIFLFSLPNSFFETFFNVFTCSKKNNGVNILQNSESLVAMTHDGNYCEVFLQFRHSQFSAMLLINKLSICVSILGWSHMQSSECILWQRCCEFLLRRFQIPGNLFCFCLSAFLMGRFPPSNVPIWTWCFTILKNCALGFWFL